MLMTRSYWITIWNEQVFVCFLSFSLIFGLVYYLCNQNEMRYMLFWCRRVSELGIWGGFFVWLRPFLIFPEVMPLGKNSKSLHFNLFRARNRSIDVLLVSTSWWILLCCRFLWLFLLGVIILSELLCLRWVISRN